MRTSASTPARVANEIMTGLLVWFEAGFSSERTAREWREMESPERRGARRPGPLVRNDGLEDRGAAHDAGLLEHGAAPERCFLVHGEVLGPGLLLGLEIGQAGLLLDALERAALRDERLDDPADGVLLAFHRILHRGLAHARRDLADLLALRGTCEAPCEGGRDVSRVHADGSAPQNAARLRRACRGER